MVCGVWYVYVLWFIAVFYRPMMVYNGMHTHTQYTTHQNTPVALSVVVASFSVWSPALSHGIVPWHIVLYTLQLFRVLFSIQRVLV